MRKLIRIAVMTAMLSALIGLAPTASADHDDQTVDANHSDRPTKKDAPAPEGECVVNGSVATTPGVNNGGVHSHYDFDSTTLQCVSQDSEIDGVFTVDADGDTDGHDCVLGGTEENPLSPAGQTCSATGLNPSQAPRNTDHPNNTHHGETCDSGWSRNPGVITAAKGMATYTGEVKFIRVGNIVDAWGYLEDDNDGDTVPDVYFKAELAFTPDDPTEVEPACAVMHDSGDSGPYITSAVLTGTAIVEAKP